jgi:hypothetical protein
MTTPKDDKKTGQKNKKREYKKPEIQSEQVSIAALAKSCNGMLTGSSGRKAAAPCTVLLS